MLRLVLVVGLPELTVSVPNEVAVLGLAPLAIRSSVIVSPECQLLPVIVKLVLPAVPLVGLTEMLGLPETLKLVLLVAVYPPEETAIGPLSAPVGTVAVICVDESTVNEVAETPPKETLVTQPLLPLMKLVPVIVTEVVPAVPLVGEKLAIVGALVTVKLALLLPVPFPVTTLTDPVVAPEGTVAVIRLPVL